MLLDSPILSTDPQYIPNLILLLVKIGFIILSFLYFVFSLIVVRQVNLMTETLITEVSPILRALSIIHAGLALGIIVLFIGLG